MFSDISAKKKEKKKEEAQALLLKYLKRLYFVR